jgi:hypothetical protein
VLVLLLTLQRPRDEGDWQPALPKLLFQSGAGTIITGVRHNVDWFAVIWVWKNRIDAQPLLQLLESVPLFVTLDGVKILALKLRESHFGQGAATVA